MVFDVNMQRINQSVIFAFVHDNLLYCVDEIDSQMENIVLP